MTLRGFLTAVRAACVACAACLTSTACDDGPKPPIQLPGSGPAAATRPAFAPIDFAALKPTDRTPARPGYAVGRILGPDGKPVARPGVRVEVQIVGVLTATAERVNLRFEASPDGTYVRPLDPGTYSPPTARIEFPFDVHHYRMPLVPTHKSESSTDAADGVVQDFAWRLTGLRPGAREDPTRAEPWLGGSIRAHYIGVDMADGRALRSPPPGTRVVFTITPKSLLADGTTGKPMVVERQYSVSGSGLIEPLIPDVPLARVEVRGEEVFPDGGRRPVLFAQAGAKSWEPTVEGVFQADTDRPDALGVVIVDFTRRER